MSASDFLSLLGAHQLSDVVHLLRYAFQVIWCLYVGARGCPPHKWFLHLNALCHIMVICIGEVTPRVSHRLDLLKT